MSSQEELLEQLPMGVMVIWDASVDYESWEAPSDTGSMIITQMNDTDDINAIWELNQTMIYTEQQAKALADAAVVAEAQRVEVAEKLPLSEDEKARLWRAVMESCSG